MIHQKPAQTEKDKKMLTLLCKFTSQQQQQQQQEEEEKAYVCNIHLPFRNFQMLS